MAYALTPRQDCSLCLLAVMEYSCLLAVMGSSFNNMSLTSTLVLRLFCVLQVYWASPITVSLGRSAVKLRLQCMRYDGQATGSCRQHNFVEPSSDGHHALQHASGTCRPACKRCMHRAVFYTVPRSAAVCVSQYSQACTIYTIYIPCMWTPVMCTAPVATACWIS